ncbi:MAG: type II toxin-antitoxin system VapC family toxin [Sterolibacteriaceae bacterium]|uniref:Ribonuclease VapC n=1 Tax=Candidatus Methylophosphatis roskildensis TaxID=2899263 RepID=A0A9D7HTB5_9PROT|nr:type II toxin-antitoxin system VapC family toxin [Candidatus Methylophosphatis roskildensis]MBK7235591.1 type II toxin-antitoxin system VapC family toxin [Sterolibacteriaceae bacterium]
MTDYLLDTNAWIALLKNNDKLVAAVRRQGVEHLYMCAPVWAELWFGACNSERVAENQARLRDLAAQVASLPFDDRAAEHCGEIRAVLVRSGQVIGPYDLQIAAIARAAGLCVVTRNVSEFERVPGLVVENWQDAT